MLALSSFFFDGARWGRAHEDTSSQCILARNNPHHCCFSTFGVREDAMEMIGQVRYIVLRSLAGQLNDSLDFHEAPSSR
jgi:hypothetical protein